MLKDYSTLIIAGTIEIILLLRNRRHKAVEYQLPYPLDLPAKNKHYIG